MDSRVVLDGRPYLSSREAGRRSGYTGDYIARLCRTQEVHGRKVGRSWFVDEEAFNEYLESSEEKKEERKKKLSEERRKEYVQSRKSLRVPTGDTELSEPSPFSHEDVTQPSEPVAYEPTPMDETEFTQVPTVEKKSYNIVSDEKVSGDNVKIFSKALIFVCAIGLGLTGALYAALQSVPSEHSAVTKDNQTPSMLAFLAGMVMTANEGVQATVARAFDAGGEQTANVYFGEEVARSITSEYEEGVGKILQPEFTENDQPQFPKIENRVIDTGILQDLKKQFSDDVEIALGNDNTGVITPIIRGERSNEEYVFIFMSKEDEKSEEQKETQ